MSEPLIVLQVDHRLTPSLRRLYDAEDIVNEYSEARLERIFREHGEERDARRVARALASARERSRISTDRLLSKEAA